MTSINLLPLELRQDLPINWPKLWPRIILLGLILILLFLYIVFYISFFAIYMQTSKLDKELIELQPQTRKALEIKREILSLKEQIDTLNSLNVKQTAWNKLLWALNDHVPQDLWLISFKNSSGQEVILKGQSLNFDSIGLFLNEINQLPFFSEVILTQTDTVLITEQIVYNFEFRAKLTEGRGK